MPADNQWHCVINVTYDSNVTHSDSLYTMWPVYGGCAVAGFTMAVILYVALCVCKGE